MVKHLASIQQVISLNVGWYEYTELLEVPSLQMYCTILVSRVNTL